MGKVSCELDGILFEFELEHDPSYILHEKFDALNTRTIKMFKAKELLAYNILININDNGKLLQFVDPGHLFAGDREKRLEDLKEFLEDSYFVDELKEKIELYKSLGSF